MSGQPVKIRNFRAADLETLYQIDRICFPEEIAFSRTELTFYLKHPKSIACVAERAGRILGFVLARIESPIFAHVLTLDIVPDFRKRRIGTSLMEELHGKLGEKGVRASILEVSTNNLPALRLYEKMHYQYLGTLSGYYHGHEDAYRMARFVFSPSKGAGDKGGLKK